MGDFIGRGLWANYDNAFTRWLGQMQGDRDPELYEAATFDAAIADLIDAVPDVDLSAADIAIVTQLASGNDVDAELAMPLAEGAAADAVQDPTVLVELDTGARIHLPDEAALEALRDVAGNLPAEGVEAASAAATSAGEAYAASAAEGSSAVVWFFTNLIEAFYNIIFALTHVKRWADWMTWTGTDEDKISLMNFIYYGASQELFFAALVLVLMVVIAGFIWRSFMWGVVRGLEGFANAIGRFAAWAGLLMVLQQILIIFMQRVFAVSEISMGFGLTFSFPVSWWAEELKLFNALVVTLCIAYTFVQGGHVRVDLVYSAISFRAKRVVDMFGSIFLMLPAAVLIWMYSWFFMWRNMINPPVSASDTLERLVTAKFRGVRWNPETIGFSPNGFNAYILFKILLVFFVFMVFVQAISFFCRSYLEWKEGPESEGKYLDKDALGDETAEIAANIH